MIEKILNDENEVNKRVYDFPASQIKLNDKKSSYYDVVEGLPNNIFQGIPGINLDKRKERYYRINTVPISISERSVNKNRNNLYEELDSVGLDYYNQLEWLIRTNTEYSGDNLIVERYSKSEDSYRVNCGDLVYGNTFNSLEQLSSDYYKNLKQILKIVGSGLI